MSDLRGGRELVVALWYLREGMMARQGPGLSMQLHRRESLDEGIARTNGVSVEQPDAVMMRRKSRMRWHSGVDLWRHEGVPWHGSAAAGGAAAHVRRGHTMGRVRQRHCGAVRIGDDRLCRIMRQSCRGGLYTNIVALGERSHPHIGGSAERFLIRIQRIREFRSRELATDHDRRLIWVLQDDCRAAGANLINGIAVRRHMVYVLWRGEGLTGAGATTGR